MDNFSLQLNNSSACERRRTLHAVPPMARYLKKSQPEMRGSLGERGAFPMMSKSGGLKPRAVAGRPSVTRLTHSSWTGIRASGRPSAAVRKILKERVWRGIIFFVFTQSLQKWLRAGDCVPTSGCREEKEQQWAFFHFNISVWKAQLFPDIVHVDSWYTSCLPQMVNFLAPCNCYIFMMIDYKKLHALCLSL